MTIEELIARHPKLFHGERPRLGIAIGPGWISLVDELCIAIEARLGDNEFHVVQIKEKCAELRFYLSHPKPGIFADIIEAAREKSKTICESCGAPGDLFRAGGAYSTMCDEHAVALSSGSGDEVYFIEDDGTTFPMPLYITRALSDGSA